jgi:hypothetical protein
MAEKSSKASQTKPWKKKREKEQKENPISASRLTQQVKRPFKEDSGNQSRSNYPRRPVC